MTSDSNAQPENPTQELRNEFAAAIEKGDVENVTKLLVDEPLLANSDLRAVEHRNDHSNGHPLHLACQQNNEKVAQLLLRHGAHPDAPGSNPDNQPKFGMPLHFAAAEHRNYRLANLLLDQGASPNGYPHCDQATIERMYYQAREAGLADAFVRQAYSQFLPDVGASEPKPMSATVGTDEGEPIQLFARMVDLGGQPPFCALVRDGFDDLLMEIIHHSQSKDGTPHDHPNSNVLNNIFGAARWHGYPKLFRRIMDHLGADYEYQSAIETIGVAIGSHNRDGTYEDYREIIVMQLELLKSRGELESAQQDTSFNPLYKIATDFSWHDNYGYRAKIANPECYVDLADLFVAWNLGDVNHLDPGTGHCPLSAAVNRGHHPGIATYIQWLLDHGADLRETVSDELNPIKIAAKKGFDEIRMLLKPESDL